jgi:hypothetical protein
MGMTASLEQITPQQLAGFIQDPRCAYDYVFSEFLENPAAMRKFDEFVQQAESRFGHAAKEQIEHIKAQSQAMKARAGIHLVKGERGPQQRPKPKPERKRFWLEKDWHVLHYLLNGTTEGGTGPLADVVLGGAEIPDVDGLMGYGPLRYLTVEQVSDIAAALAEVDLKQLVSKFDHEDAVSKRIYLAETIRDQSDWSYFTGFFEAFRDFYKDAAMHGNAMLLQIT